MSHKPDRLCATVFDSAMGWFGLAWRGDAVCRLTFGHRTRRQAIQSLGDSPLVLPDACPDPTLVTRLQDYTNGTADDFSDVVVDAEHLTNFGRRVMKACRAIPYGCTVSYATLAERAGSPMAARAVGQCMAANRVPLIVPCHRVVGVGGRLGGFSAPGGIGVKQRLLDLESPVHSQ